MTRPTIAALWAAALLGAASSGLSAVAQDPSPTFTSDDIHVGEPPPAAPAASTPPAAPSGPRATASAIAWRRSFEAARQEAKAGQLIVVDVYTDWCGYCKLMDRKVYADRSVATFAASHVFVKLNAEDKGEGTRFARAAGVRGFPTTIVYRNDGAIVARQAGAFSTPQDFLAWLNEAGN